MEEFAKLLLNHPDKLRKAGIWMSKSESGGQCNRILQDNYSYRNWLFTDLISQYYSLFLILKGNHKIRLTELIA